MQNSLTAWLLERNHRSFIAIQLISATAAATFLLLALLVRWFPPPGIAVAIVALLAAAMSIHKGMRETHKAVWMLLIGTFLTLEMFAIVYDRNVQAEQQRKALREERENFSRIGTGIEDAIIKSETQFKATMHQSNQLLASVTGGDSFAVLLPYTMYQDAELPLFIENRGSNTLTGVTVTVHSQGVWWPGAMKLAMSENDKRVFVGTLAPKERQMITARLLPENLGTGDVDADGKPFHTAFVRITAQNFTADEFLDLKKVRGDQRHKEKWVFRYKIYRDLNRKKVRTLEKTDWSDDVNEVRRLP